MPVCGTPNSAGGSNRPAPSTMKKPTNLIYGVADKPPLHLTLLLGLQHALPMSSTLVLVAVVRPASDWPTSLVQNVLRLSMIGVGIGTILQALNRFGIGSGYLCPQLVGPAFLPASVLAVKTGCLALLSGMTIVTGLFQAVFSRFLYRMRVLFPTEVVGVVVTMVGVVLIPLGLAAFFGDNTTLAEMGPSTSSSNVGLSIASGATSRWIAFAAGAIFIAFAFVPKLAMIFVIMPGPVRGAILLYVACFMIVAGLQIITSRMLDSRKIFIVGVSIISGLGVYIAPDVTGQAPGLIEPLVGSALSLGTSVAVGLNLLFRIGISKKASLLLSIGPGASEEVYRFTEEHGRMWGARSDVIYRVTAGLSEFIEATAALDPVPDDVNIELSFDELAILVEIGYRGEPLLLPATSPSENELLRLDFAKLGVPGLLLRHFASRIDQTSRDGQVSLKLTFDH